MQLIVPGAVNLIDSHPATGKVIGRRKNKAAPRAVENQLDRCSRIVWVIRRELNLLFRRLRCEQKYRVVDAKLRKPHHVNKRRHILLQRLEQLLRRALLMMRRERENHSPVASLKIALPCPAAL